MNTPGVNTLGFDKPPAETRVVVAMSGGVDSSVVASMLHAEGYEVIGITLQLYDHGAMLAKKGACCAGQDIQDARRIAETLGIPHYVLNYESKFRDGVMDDFVETYMAGETPVPCVKCNQTVKFRDLLGAARDLGADCLATGHYVRREIRDGKAVMLQAADPRKDQSYFLFATTQEQLDFLRFPLGGLQKEETRRLAESFGLAVADKPDSQDICFVPNGDYASVIEKLRPGALDAGEIVSLGGEVLGRHDGIIRFTVGQRRGIGVAAGEPLYVVRLEPETRRVVVGPREALSKTGFDVRDTNWIGEEASETRIKWRSSQTAMPASLQRGTDGWSRIELDEPQYAVSPGQACVFYDGERMIGGGWIARRS